ncbi:DUF3592 domain-containing protein [Marinobacter confluentis]|uniref:DUF3592 domain-containing protein n=1 Tax=Marinobacter confluentis TaxID=1697557 RepID=A0A4Z1B9Z6_9GAMM|nr:DUF3592 domain-containing protein [Marinobacter confluentis]TGN38503.1 DUF3592 domain-containing protein [Marinobacter confluentis]
MRVYDFLKLVFSIVGGALLLGAFAAYQSTSGFLVDALEVPGTVTDLVYDRSGDSSAYYPVVQFEDATGRPIEFRSSSGSNPASYNVGEKVPVLYTPGEPESARINGFFSLWGLPLIVGILGGAFFLVGVLMILVPLIRRSRGARLRETGQLVVAKIQGVEQNTGLVMNGQSPFRIVTQWQNPATASVHVFRSDNIWFDPTDHIPGESVNVYIHPDNPKRYWVDTSFLPKMAS